MTPRSFEKLFSQIDRDRKATVPYSVLVRLIRGSGTPLSPDQLARLEALDTDILCVGKRRYTSSTSPISPRTGGARTPANR